MQLPSWKRSNRKLNRSEELDAPCRSVMKPGMKLLGQRQKGGDYVARSLRIRRRPSVPERVSTADAPIACNILSACKPIRGCDEMIVVAIAGMFIPSKVNHLVTQE